MRSDGAESDCFLGWAQCKECYTFVRWRKCNVCRENRKDLRKPAAQGKSSTPKPNDRSWRKRHIWGCCRGPVDGRGALKGSVPVTVRPREAALVSGCGWRWSGRRGGSNIASTSAMCVRALMSFVHSKRSPRAREGTRSGYCPRASLVPCLPRLKLDFK